MPLYMTQFSYTRDAWHDLVTNPQNRQEGVAALLDNMGGRLVSMYYGMGEWDGFIVYEAPDAATASAGILAAVGTGHLKDSRTTQIFTMEESMEIWKKAGGQSYAAPQDPLEEIAL